MQIFVGNLVYTATVDEVRRVFEAYGEVARVHLLEDRETGRPRGFGFVEMPDDSQARAAIAGRNGTHVLLDPNFADARVVAEAHLGFVGIFGPDIR